MRGKSSAALAAGAGVGVAVLLLAGKAFAATDEVAPDRPRKVKGRAVVAFTQVGVPYSKHLRRIQVAEPIEVLVAKASKAMGRKVSEVAFILATLIASEAESQPDAGKVAIAHAALTQADKLGVTLRTLLAPKRLGGKLGGQLGGYASTARPPTKHDVELAEGVISGRYPNPTPGAVQWDSPIAQDKLLRKGTPGYDMTSDALARRREGEGKVPVYVAEVPRSELRLWRPAA